MRANISLFICIQTRCLGHDWFKKIQSSLGFILLFFIASPWVFAQTPAFTKYQVRNYTDENGLPQNSVKAIMKDKSGFLWLGTEAGLVRFDGHKFFTFNKTVIPITSNRINIFVPAPVSDGKGNEMFSALTENNESVQPSVHGLAFAHSGEYRRYLDLAPVLKISKKQNIYLGSLPTLHKHDTHDQNYMTTSGNNDVYVWRQDDIVHFKNGKQASVTKGEFTLFFLVGSYPFATNENGDFIRIDGKTQHLVSRLAGDINANPAFKAGKADYVLFWNNISKRPFLYLNKSFYSLERLENGELSTRLILTGFDFEQNKIASVFYDETLGYLFLGSLTKGLFVIKKQNFTTLKILLQDADNVYYSQLAWRDNSVLTAQGYAMGIRSQSSDTAFRRVSGFMKDHDYKYSLAMNQDSSIWMGEGYELFRLDKYGKLIKKLTLKKQFKSMYADEADQLWLGGQGSLFLLAPPYASPETIVEGDFGEILVIHRENRRTLLLATKKGLFRFDKGSGKLDEIKNFANITIRSFYTTSEGTWLTTYGNGLYFVGKSKIVQFPVDNELFMTNAHCIIEDSKGFFWVTTNKGLFQVVKKQLLNYINNSSSPVYYHYYDKSNGFETNEFNGGCLPCAVKLPNGTVSLPSMDGLVWFSPLKIRPELPGRDIFISEIELNGKMVPVSENLKLSRDFTQLRLRVSTPYFGHINNIHMSYALTKQGKSAVWFPVSEDFIISLSNVPYGKYDLLIRKINGFGENNYAYKKITINIPPAWFETWWFWSLLVVLLQLVVIAIIRLRTRYMVRREREANLRRHYRVISQIVAAVNHDIQTPLHYLTYSLQQVNNHLHLQPNADQLINRMSDESLNTTQRIGTLTKNLLDYIKLQNQNDSSRRELTSVRVHDLVADTCKLFQAMADFKNLRLINEVESDLIVLSDPSLLSIVIHNLLDNAVKFSKSEVRISSVVAQGSKEIVIEDSGDGMPQDLMIWLNRSYKSYREWLRLSRHPEQKGIGLVIVKDLCLLLNIDLHAHVKPHSGTMVHLVFD